MKRATPRQVGKSRANESLLLSISRFYILIIRIKVASKIMVAPTPNPNKK